MQQKVITILFNSSFCLKSHKAIWAFSNNKHIKSYIIYSILSILILTAGIIYDRHDAFPVNIVIGSAMLVYLFFKWTEFFERKSKYFKKVKKHAQHYEQESIESTYIFSDNEFEYSDVEKSFRLSWFLFKPFAIYKDNILLSLKDGGVSFTIGKDELGEEEYSELCFILKEKTG